MQARVKYIGTALPADSDVETIFDTTSTGHWTDMLNHMGVKRVRFEAKHSHNATVNTYFSDDGGTNWEAVSSTAVTGGGSDTNIVDALVEGYKDWKMEWVNGGTTQTEFKPVIALVCDRSVAT